jgi:hypothetical protein
MQDTRPPRFNVFLLFIICCVTCGLFVPIWFFMRRRWLNILTQDQKLGAGMPAGALALDLFAWLLVFASLVFADEGVVTMMGYGINAFAFVSGLLVLGAAFKTRAIIDWHYNYTREMGISVSGVATFFFTILYLQYVINRLPEPDMSRVE